MEKELIAMVKLADITLAELRKRGITTMAQTEEHLALEARVAALESPDPPERNSELWLYIIQMVLGAGLVALGHLTGDNWLTLIGAIPTALSPVVYGAGRITLKKEAISNGRTD